MCIQEPQPAMQLPVHLIPHPLDPIVVQGIHALYHRDEGLIGMHVFGLPQVLLFTEKGLPIGGCQRVPYVDLQGNTGRRGASSAVTARPEAVTVALAPPPRRGAQELVERGLVAVAPAQREQGIDLVKRRADRRSGRGVVDPRVEERAERVLVGDLEVVRGDRRPENWRSVEKYMTSFLRMRGNGSWNTTTSTSKKKTS